MQPLIRTNLRAPGHAGKVRDLYDLGDGRLALIATDRISAFDVVLPTPVPGKGRLLTQIAAFWLRWVEASGLCRTHLLTTDASELPESLFGPGGTGRSELEGCVTIGRRCRVLPVECVVRGYLEGSGWADYQRTGRVCGIGLPEGLERCQRLPEPIFTPASKAEQGAHDENIDEAAARAALGDARYEWVRATSLAIYSRAAEHARQRGIIIADTKFEFGVDQDNPDAEPMLIDEVLTPDSSRFWPAAGYTPGKPQPSFDKQFVREYLDDLVAQGRWDKRPPGPELPPSIVDGTLARYRQACELLTG